MRNNFGNILLKYILLKYFSEILSPDLSPNYWREISKNRCQKITYTVANPANSIHWIVCHCHSLKISTIDSFSVHRSSRTTTRHKKHSKHGQKKRVLLSAGKRWRSTPLFAPLCSAFRWKMVRHPAKIACRGCWSTPHIFPHFSVLAHTAHWKKYLRSRSKLRDYLYDYCRSFFIYKGF